MPFNIDVTFHVDSSLQPLLEPLTSYLLMRAQSMVAASSSAPAVPETPATNPVPTTAPGPASYAAAPTPVAPPAPAPAVPITSPAPAAPAAAVPPAAPPAMAPAPVPAPVPTPAPPVVPTTPAPGYTLAQLSNAGAALVSADPSKSDQLIALLHQFGVQAITQLPPEHYGAFATALRGLGAGI